MPYPDGARLDLPGGPEEVVNEDDENMANARAELTIFTKYVESYARDNLVPAEWQKLDVLVDQFYATLNKWKREVR